MQAALDAGANINAKSPNGKTVLQVAVETRNEPLMDFVFQNGGEVDLYDLAVAIDDATRTGHGLFSQLQQYLKVAFKKMHQTIQDPQEVRIFLVRVITSIELLRRAHYSQSAEIPQDVVGDSGQALLTAAVGFIESNGGWMSWPAVVQHGESWRQAHYTLEAGHLLPEWIGVLSVETALDLSYKGLTSLPASFGYIHVKGMINLSGNTLTSLPSSMDRLSPLQVEGLSGRLSSDYLPNDKQFASNVTIQDALRATTTTKTVEEERVRQQEEAERLGREEAERLATKRAKEERVRAKNAKLEDRLKSAAKATEELMTEMGMSLDDLKD